MSNRRIALSLAVVLVVAVVWGVVVAVFGLPLLVAVLVGLPLGWLAGMAGDYIGDRLRLPQ